jgi:hypothetical protein
MNAEVEKNKLESHAAEVAGPRTSISSITWTLDRQFFRITNLEKTGGFGSY